MRVSRYTIKPTSPWITPLRSDTLHGLIACQVREWEGESACLELIERCKNGDAPYTCSSAFPTGFLPHPALPPMTRAAYKKAYGQNKTLLINTLQESKSYRKTPYISLTSWQKHRGALSLHALFDDFLADKKRAEAAAQKSGLLSDEATSQRGTEPHNTISRNTQTVIDGGLFFHEVTYGDASLDVYVQTDTDADAKRFDKYFRLLGELGFGADSTVGKGRFEVQNVEDVTAFFADDAKATHYMSLSVFATEDCHDIDGYYKIFTKRGRTWVGKSTASPFKKPFLAFEEGSLFRNVARPSQSRPDMFRHGVLSNIHVDAQVVQLCHALTLPCVLREEECLAL